MMLCQCLAVAAWLLGSLLLADAAAAEQCDSPCDLAIVGAGVGGAYAAWRAASAGYSVCVFEMANRPGGRIHSLRGMGPKKDLVVEAGAYRFTATNVCNEEFQWCINTPITREIVKELQLHAAVYDPDPTSWDHDMRKLVDSDGNDAGYLTLPESLLAAAVAKGARVQYKSRVTGLFVNNQGGVNVQLASGVTCAASAVLLNIPQGPLLELLRHSGEEFQKEYAEALYSPTSFDIMKLYVHYEDAWWRNDLGLTSGHFSSEMSPNSSAPQESPAAHQWHQEPVPLKGQYHDGNVLCDLPEGKCRGYLQAYYANTGVEFYKVYHPLGSSDAALELHANSTQQLHLLKAIHQALVKLHAKELAKANATEKVLRMLPDSGVLSIWRDTVDGINAGCHMPKLGQHPAPGNVTAEALQPFPTLPVYVANEAYGPFHCWAEGSLNMSHRVLERLGVPLQPLREQWVEPRYPNPPLDPFLLPRKHTRTASIASLVV